MLLIRNECDEIISKYGVLILLIYILNISIGINHYELIIILLLLYWLLNDNKSLNSIYGILFLMSMIFIFNANSLYGVFISIELISFIMITYINLYIQDKYPGILYYLFSGLFSALFILSLGYLYMGYTIAYTILSLVFIWKLGLGPLHILMPYIYNSLSPKRILFIDIICKFLLFYIFSKLIITIPINLYFISIISLIIGVLSALKDYNLLNILIYSSISNYGLLLMIIKYNNIFFIYLMFYSFMTLIYLYLITHIWILYSFNNNYYIFLWFILIINMIGVPPLTGFWIKLYLLYILVLNYNYLILFIVLFALLLLSSVYIRILLTFIINNNLNNMDLYNNNIFHSHFISSLILSLTFPIFL